MTKVNWLGIIPVVIVVLAILLYKGHVTTRKSTISNKSATVPQVLLVADLSEAGSADSCGAIIHAVREARSRGIQVAEMNPGDHPQTLRRYHVITSPTVLIFDPRGQVIVRFEGEASKTVTSVKNALNQLRQR